ncbi:nicotinate (nicotinamide) nucleotide adenylyltransferase [Flavobacteria bacterium MS024-3C]|jgi:nicotinate-nucleotide adenylyltransferase|nr:nicotinate (nicotinamide) nucleotide adenylyltransferase [Flavobacteria bacterium MS024-3C]MBT4840347.1 nicotinate-nucleotide adenylyltransferase [Flavobacteriaceae bacterium]MBT5393898.1 nicotinate-nucleotide adenylyltransferase [Flavobacteriaceae bacterium]MBT5584771.1 nicotinate-nucleotide adenylyltransferase [Flavobacteriaceae bacterium]MBT5921607.1 nicotinate-nucleotide adenylyltransferase [Flavobacteriaceae bacterium]|tara:strand:+ start:240 stop:848 length:609 start_codon:yes stop_codon:yes gene_type:complete
MKQIGLFFGSFNPVHQGHLILANYLVEETALEEVWFVITPQSPFKQKQRLLDNHHRLALVEEAIEGYPKLKVSTVEFGLPAPQYTALTIAHLMEKHPEASFSLIVGQDHLKSFHKWYNYQALLEGHQIYVYPRMPEEALAASKPLKQPKPEILNHSNLILVSAPVVEISSSYIRKALKAGKNIRPLLPPAVWKYMDEMNFYR